MTTENKGPLAGIKVIDMSTVLLGPYAGQILGDLGADVIRVESPKSDMTRWAGNSPHPGFGTIFMACNRNKRSLCLDLKKESAKAALREVVKDADVFLHNVRLKAVEKLGFGYEAVKAIKPDIVYVHAVGFGSDGPHAGRPAYDDLVQAAGGAASLNTLIHPEEEPRFVPTLMADKTTGLHAAYAVLAALFHKERTGEGQFVEVPMLESFASFLMIEHLNGHVFEPPTGQYGYHRVINFHRRPYRTADGFICIMPYSAEQWRTVLRLGGAEVADDDPRLATMAGISGSIQELYKLLSEVIPSRTTQDWLDLLMEADVPVSAVNTIETLKDEPHLKATDFFEVRDHAWEGGYVSMKPPVKFSGSPSTVRRDPPALGEHNREVLEQAGVTGDVIDAMEAEGALYSIVPAEKADRS